MDALIALGDLDRGRSDADQTQRQDRTSRERSPSPARPRPSRERGALHVPLPDAASLDALEPGDLMKIGFEHTDPAAAHRVERMWVEITAVGEQPEGVLLNMPLEPTAAVREGDAVAFERRHVLDVSWREKKAGPPATAKRAYPDLCIVDLCVLDGSRPVEYLYREEPGPQGANGSARDGGWRIRGRRGGETEPEMSAREVAAVTTGAVLNRDDSWLPWIDAPVGTELMRRWPSGEYEVVSG